EEIEDLKLKEKMTGEHNYIKILVLVYLGSAFARDCNIPLTLRGTWFYRENRVYHTTEINADSMSGRGYCVASNSSAAEYNMVFKEDTSSCYHCVKFYVRTVNILEKVESGCINLRQNELPTLENVCRSVTPDMQLITLFLENFVPVNCRSGLEGVWQFAYQDRYRNTGECDHPNAMIESCQTAGSQFLISNQKFTINYRKCETIKESFDGSVEYSCLGDWFVGKNHFFAVANTKESRKDEKYRCFLKNRDDDLYMGQSDTPECNKLKSVEQSPVRFRLTPVKNEIVVPGCNLPQNFTGDWINTANIDADVVINQTHIIETWHPDVGRYRQTIYVCREQRGTRFLMTRQNVDGCQKDFICFDFVPRHHNIIRYRKSVALSIDDFSTVCSWARFPGRAEWRYDLLLTKDPVPIRCPVAGKFKFDQKGDIPFETRILGGITESPRPDVYCKQNISDFSVCDTEQKEIAIKENYCLSVDYKGRPVDIYSDPDYKLKCIGFWKENFRSYLITYDELDAFSKYRCWVYQRADLTKVLLSQALGPFCSVRQEVTSWNYTEGAAVALKMEEYERERDQCPMNFDDGTNPWSTQEAYIQVFRFGRSGASKLFTFSIPLVIIWKLFAFAAY
ncbi:hypothetical protein QYM36_002511, partial [Artemia franciscana]